MIIVKKMNFSKPKENTMTQKHAYNLPYLYSIVFISALGCLLFGYDWVVIGGAKPMYKKYMMYTTTKLH